MKDIENEITFVAEVIGTVPKNVNLELGSINEMAGNQRLEHRAWRRLQVLKMVVVCSLDQAREEQIVANQLWSKGFRLRGEWPLLRICNYITPRPGLFDKGGTLLFDGTGNIRFQKLTNGLNAHLSIEYRKRKFFWRTCAILTFLTAYHDTAG